MPVILITAEAKPLDRAIVVVNDNVITSSELESQVELLRQQILAKKMQLPADKVLRKQVLQHLIDVDLQLQLAKKNDLTIDNTDLNEAISKIAESNHLSLTQLREEIIKQGLSFEDYRENIRKEMLIGRIQQKAVGQEVVVTAEQIEDHLKTYEQDKKQQQQTYHLQNIVIPLPEEPTSGQIKKAKEKASMLLTKIKQGEDFNRLAIAESSGEYALEGGDLGERHLAELPEIFSAPLAKMKVGEVYGPLRAGNGFQLIKLVSIGGVAENHLIEKTHVRHILLKQDASMTSDEAFKQINTIRKPIQSPFGWHLIEVLERKTIDDSDSFQRQQVRQFIHQRKFNEAVQNWQQHLRADAYVKILDKDLA